ncbi:class I SAM-dependent methyltransferase [Paenibacillus sp. 1001270B_150601_E10]|uniref:class I SAM-dependent methyltransferase n=1 Tax=Paenibacillus sp. 1001270B_150601_E10 TaxID=2787079 RepID=UPI0018A07FB6|nr:class I SAM-dependent methyltransferase [Paenibacillus sp. 1001270B_150601_E10]
MGMEWYDAIARRNGGYRSDAVYAIEGVSGEVVFEKELADMLSNADTVLDAGCGHGEFTLRMSKNARHIIGFDFSVEMIKIANQLLAASKVENVQFVQATTKLPLPFKDEQFDLIYDRRGPTSILEHSRILRSGGTVFGIHSGSLDLVTRRLHENGFIDMEIREFNDAVCIYPSQEEFIRAMSDTPGHPDYNDPKHREELDRLIAQHMSVEGKIVKQDYRFIWKAMKP